MSQRPRTIPVGILVSVGESRRRKRRFRTLADYPPIKKEVNLPLRIGLCAGGGVLALLPVLAGMVGLNSLASSHGDETNYIQIAVHMLAAVPNGTYVECFPDPERDPLWASFIKNRAPIRDGIIEVPQGPGFGLELDWGQIEKYRLDR